MLASSGFDPVCTVPSCRSHLPNNQHVVFAAGIFCLKAIRIYLPKQLRYEFCRGLVSIYVAELFRLIWRTLPYAQANSVGEPRSWLHSFLFLFLLMFGRSN